MENARDWLVRVKNWILLDNPNYDKKTQVIQYNPLKKRTKKQTNELLELFKEYIEVQRYIMEEM
jgi:beta-galactosidase beta subunit